METQNRYIPGVCNIDAKGRRRRATFGVIGIIITLAAWGLLQFSASVSAYWQVWLIVPAFVGFLGIWQAKFSFCVADAAKQQYEIAGKIGSVMNKEHIARDKKKATTIYFYSIGSAILLTASLFVISLIIKNF